MTLDYQTPSTKRRPFKISMAATGLICGLSYPPFLLFNGSMDEPSSATSLLFAPINFVFDIYGPIYGHESIVFPIALAYLIIQGALLGIAIHYITPRILSPKGLAICLALLAATSIRSILLDWQMPHPLREIDLNNCRGNQLAVVNSLTLTAAFSAFTLFMLILFFIHRRLTPPKPSVSPPHTHPTGSA